MQAGYSGKGMSNFLYMPSINSYSGRNYMKLSFKEKSLWLVLASLVLAFGYYFATALPGHGPSVVSGDVYRFAVAVIVVVVLQITGHILITIADRHTNTDERDQIIGLKGTRNGNFILAIGVFLSLSTALLVEGNFAFTHVLLGFWILSHIVEIISQLIHYHRGA
jgi:hypothetical protein